MTSAPRWSDLAALSCVYPHPYSPGFLDELRSLAQDAGRDDAMRRIYERRLHQRAVLFFVAGPGARGASSPAAMLDELATNAWMDMTVWQALPRKDSIVELGGGGGVLIFESAAEAVEAARRVRDRFLESSLEASFGIDTGPLLLFENGRGGWSRAAGAPVN